MLLLFLSNFLEYDLFARGALIYGELIHTSKYIFGPALVEAVKLEENEIFPRIIIDESLSNLIIPTISQITYGEFFNNFKYVKTDTVDNKKYIDFIGEINNNESIIKNIFFETIKKLIDNHIYDEKLFIKYEWLKLKLNEYNY